MSPKFQRISPIVPVAGNIYQGDSLNRRPDCEYLRDAILAAKTPCVLAVDASWGAGKTVFLQMLQEECKVRGMPCVFFDAWKTDFHNDALAAMIGEIEHQLPKQENIPAKMKTWARKIGGKIPWPPFATAGIGLVGGAAADAATGGAAAGLTAAAEAGKGVVGALKNKAIGPVAEYAARRDSLAKFKAALKKLPTLNGDEAKPLVFFVDELDRCRPIFAVEVLEKIKHVFDVPGVFFVVAVNKGQLQKTLKSVYGKINAALYLRRFFDFEFVLENRDAVVIDALERCQAETDKIADGDDLREVLPLLCRDFGLQPRDQEQAAALVTRALALTPATGYFRSVYVAFFVVLKFANPELYQQCVAGMRGNLENFPFAGIVDYYESVTGVQKILQAENQVIPHRLPMLALCAMRFTNDKVYAQEMRKSANEEWEKQSGGMSFWSDVVSLADGRHRWGGLEVLENPRFVLEKIELGAKKRR